MSRLSAYRLNSVLPDTGTTVLGPGQARRYRAVQERQALQDEGFAGEESPYPGNRMVNAVTDLVMDANDMPSPFPGKKGFYDSNQAVHHVGRYQLTGNTAEDLKGMAAEGAAKVSPQDPGTVLTGDKAPAPQGPQKLPVSQAEQREAVPEDPWYQQGGAKHMGLYLSNPLESLGRQRMNHQLMEAPLGGWVRRGLEGQDPFGAGKITAEQALMAERVLGAGVYGGVGSFAALAAIDALNGNEQTPGTIPLYVD